MIKIGPTNNTCQKHYSNSWNFLDVTIFFLESSTNSTQTFLFGYATLHDNLTYHPKFEKLKGMSLNFCRWFYDFYLKRLFIYEDYLWYTEKSYMLEWCTSFYNVQNVHAEKDSLWCRWTGHAYMKSCTVWKCK